MLPFTSTQQEKNTPRPKDGSASLAACSMNHLCILPLMVLEKSALQLSCIIEGDSFPYFAHPPGEDRITFELIVLTSILDPLFGLSNLILFNQIGFFAV